MGKGTEGIQFRDINPHTFRTTTEVWAASLKTWGIISIQTQLVDSTLRILCHQPYKSLMGTNSPRIICRAWFKTLTLVSIRTIQSTSNAKLWSALDIWGKQYWSMIGNSTQEILDGVSILFFRSFYTSLRTRNTSIEIFKACQELVVLEQVCV